MANHAIGWGRRPYRASMAMVVTTKPTAVTSPRTTPSPKVVEPVALANIAAATAVTKYSTSVATKMAGLGRNPSGMPVPPARIQARPRTGGAYQIAPRANQARAPTSAAR